MVTTSEFDSLDPIDDAKSVTVKEEMVHANWNKSLSVNVVKVKLG